MIFARSTRFLLYQMPLPLRLLGQQEASTTAHVIIRVKKIISNHDEINVKLAGMDVISRNGVDRSNPFIEIYKNIAADQHRLVYKTEVRRWPVPIKS